MDTLALLCEGAVFPNGLTAPGIIPAAVDIAQGWPMAGDLDTALAAGRSMVTVYAVPSTTTVLPTPLGRNIDPLSPIVHGLGADGDRYGFTLWGKPGTGEYAALLIDGGRAYSYAAFAGDLPETMMAYLAAAIAADYPGTAFDGQRVNIVGARSLIVRIGAPALQGEVIGRQRQQFRLTVRSPNPADRAALGRAIVTAVRQNLRVVFADDSEGFLTFSRDDLSDERQNVRIYRRDIIVFVQWDTIDSHEAYEVTSVNVRLASITTQNRSY